MTDRPTSHHDEVPGVWMWYDRTLQSLFGTAPAVRVLSAIASEPGGLDTETIAVAADVDEDRIAELVAPLVEIDIVTSWTDDEGCQRYTIADHDVLSALEDLDRAVGDRLHAGSSVDT